MESRQYFAPRADLSFFKLTPSGSPDSPFVEYTDSQTEEFSAQNFSGSSSEFSLDYSDCQKMKHVLWQLESDLMAPEETSPPVHDLKWLLMACAQALDEEKLTDFDRLVEQARMAVSISGDPIQRLGAYMIEGLVARKEASGSNIYRALRCKEPAGKDLLSYMHILYEICPYLKFGYMAANGAIAGACRRDDLIHIIDFQIGQGTQWITLLQALASRPGGAPRVRITGIDDPVSRHARGDGLAAVANRLAAISERFGIQVEFHAMPVFVRIESLNTHRNRVKMVKNKERVLERESKGGG